VTTLFALASDVGQLRPNNEDASCVLPEFGLYAVADGMGGHVAGELASRLALDTLREVVKTQPAPQRLTEVGELLCEAILAANSTVFHEAETRGLLGMGTTLTALRVRGRTAVVGHVGDSRAYLINRSGSRQLTHDQTLTSLLIDSGSLDPADAAHHPDRNVLLQAIGPTPAVQPELVQARIPKGSRLLLSTDGLHDIVPEQELTDLAAEGTLEEAVHGLIDRANALGGPDNITVVMVEP
jgi:protein phosphatase